MEIEPIFQSNSTETTKQPTKELAVKFANLTDELVRSRKIKDMDDFRKFDGKTNEEIEKAILGVEAVDYLEGMSSLSVAIPVGRTNINRSQTMEKLIKKYKGIYSVR